MTHDILKHLTWYFLLILKIQKALPFIKDLILVASTQLKIRVSKQLVFVFLEKKSIIKAELDFTSVVILGTIATSV